VTISKREWVLTGAVAVILALTVGPMGVHAAPVEKTMQGATVVEQATVWSVKPFMRNGYGYCTITLKVPASVPHIRYLTWVFGESCTAYAQGAAVTLVYDVSGKTKTLRTWY
jgi:hypothetical protein